MKKPVVATNLTIRFYKKDGWTLELLKPLIKGDIIDSEVAFADKPASAYFVLDPTNSDIDLDGLCAISEVNRLYDDYPLDDDRTFLAKHLGIFKTSACNYGKVINISKVLEKNADK